MTTRDPRDVWDDIVHIVALEESRRASTPRDRAIARRVQAAIEKLMRDSHAGTAPRPRRRRSKGRSR